MASIPKRINEILRLIWPRVDLPGETIRIKLKGKTKLFDDPIGPLEVTRLQRVEGAQTASHCGVYLCQRTHTEVQWQSACEGPGPSDDLSALL
jgi:hypothetical protein